jgi:DNA-directed RNA polymerase II subunit RPB1
MAANNKTVSKIIGIQFSIMSPDEILKGSVAEITNRETYVNNKPVIGGLFWTYQIGTPGVLLPISRNDYQDSALCLYQV